MTFKRLFFAFAPLALLAACGEEPADGARAASGDVLEGSISDAMLPVDRVQSEPPLEDPEAFAEVQEKAAAQAPTAEAGGDAPDAEAAEPEEPAVEVPTFEAESE